MKKVLLGLLAMSAVSMAAATDLTKPAQAGTDVFQGVQEGSISVTGKLTSDVPLVKYVIFASSDNGTTMNSTLDLQDFVVTSNGSAKGGFVGTNPDVFVKRLNGTTVKDLDQAVDKVKFTFVGGELTGELNGFNGSREILLNAGDSSIVRAVALWSNAMKTEIEALGYKYSGAYGNVANANGVDWRMAHRLEMTHIENGKLKLTSAPTNDGTNKDAEFNKLLTYFAGGKSIDSSVKIKVVVE